VKIENGQLNAIGPSSVKTLGLPQRRTQELNKEVSRLQGRNPISFLTRYFLSEKKGTGIFSRQKTKKKKKNMLQRLAEKGITVLHLQTAVNGREVCRALLG